MVTREKTFNITRGDSWGINFEITDSEGTQTALDAVYFSVKENPDDNQYIFQKSLGHGITALTGGGYYVKINPTDTQYLEQKKYYYDLEVTIGDDVYTFLKGMLDIRWDITKES